MEKAFHLTLKRTNQQGTVISSRFLGELRELTIALNTEGELLEVIAHTTAATQFKPGDRVHNAVGCSRCAGAGYRGRIAVFEVLTLSDEISRLASNGADNLEIEAAAIAAGMTTMSQDAAAKAQTGLTSPAEVIRVTGFR